MAQTKKPAAMSAAHNAKLSTTANGMFVNFARGRRQWVMIYARAMGGS